MKVRLLVSRAGPGLSQSVGDVIDVPADEAKRMVAAGQAVAATSRKKKAAKKKAARTSSRELAIDSDRETAVEE